jgi:hypothetical protein
MNPADKTIQELTQSLHQSQETIEQLTKILSKSEQRSQLLERTFRWLAVLFICLTMTVFYVGFDWVNKAQATSGKTTQLTNAPAETQETATTNQKESNSRNKFKYQRQSCQGGMQLMMVKQAKDLLVTGLNLDKKINQLPQDNPMRNPMTMMNNYLNGKLFDMIPNSEEKMKEKFNKMFADSSRIACDTLVQVMNITRKLEEFKADWNRVRSLLLNRLYEVKTDTDNKTESKPKKQDPLYPVANLILDYLQKENAIKIKPDRKNPVDVKNPSRVDSALSTFMALGIMKGIASLNFLDDIENALKAVPRMNNNMRYMNANMEDMNIHMYHMMRDMGIMSYDMDSTLGRAGRNMPWMPW